ncbi:MAG: alanine racemase [Armatimonadota bacterium]
MNRGAWLEIDIDAISHNVSVVRHLVGPHTRVLAVVKANGYGHGIVESAQAALRGGATMLGVAFVGEAALLRDAGITAHVLIMTPSLPEDAPEVVAYGCHQVVSDVRLARALSKAALEAHSTAYVHLKVDTGMTRIGVEPERAVDLAQEIASLPGVKLVGLCSHLATGEEDTAFILYQLDRLLHAEQIIRTAGINVSLRHIASSSATAACPQTWLDMVRIGLLTYGIPAGGEHCPRGIRPALSLKARLTQVKRANAGSSVSYARTCTLARDSVLGIVPIGYADGFPLSLSNQGRVLVRGAWARVLGRVCMDQFIVDLTDIPGADVGDEVVIIGSQGTRTQTVHDLASTAGTIAHDIISGLSARIPRLYVSAENNRVAGPAVL